MAPPQARPLCAACENLLALRVRQPRKHEKKIRLFREWGQLGRSHMLCVRHRNANGWARPMHCDWIARAAATQLTQRLCIICISCINARKDNLLCQLIDFMWMCFYVYTYINVCVVKWNYTDRVREMLATTAASTFNNCFGCSLAI